MATKSTQLKKALKIASRVKSKTRVKQNPPQSASYTKSGDKQVPAKAVGYRFTDRFINSATGKALGISAKSKPTASQIEKYKDKKYSDGSRYIYSEARKDKSDVSYKDRLKKGGVTQNPPQSTSYNVVNDKEKYAKPVGYRFTDRFINSATGKRLGISQGSKPTASQIEKYKNKTYSDGTRYLYMEAREDKSDKSYTRRLDYGGDLMQDDYMDNHKTQNTYLRIKPWRIFNGYTISQKYHFLHDHGFNMIANQLKDGNNIMYQELPTHVQQAFVEHTKMGQYEDGGEMARGGKTKKMYYHILEYGNYGNIGYQGYYDTQEEAQKEVKRLQGYFPNLTFQIFVDTSRNEPPITTMADGGYMADGGLARDRKFISKQKWEQTYERKKPASIYKSNWFWFENGGEMEDGGMMAQGGQTAPQSQSYSKRNDRPIMAKPVGWRFTERGANRLGVNPYRKPYASEIEQYGNKKFFNGDSYMDYETRKDKSDIKPKTGLADGGSVNYGRAWHLDRAKHNKREDYEVPLENRKMASGGFFGDDSYNYGRAWHLDRAKHNKSEDYEIPLENRKMAKGGYTYVPKEFIDSITTSNDVEFDNSEILDGAYVKGRNRKFEDGGHMDDDYAKGGRIANSDSRSYSENHLDFKGNNLEGKTLSNGDYVVLSYGWYALWYWVKKTNTWYGNATKFSASTSRQASQSRPTYDAIMLPKEALEKVMSNSSMGLDEKEMGGGVETLTK